MRLIEDGAVPFQPVFSQGFGDGINAPSDGPRGVDVIDAQPVAVMVSRIEAGNAATKEPAWSSPVGEGAKRPRWALDSATAGEPFNPVLRSLISARVLQSMHMVAVGLVEPLITNLDTTGITVAIIIVLQSVQRGIDLLDQLSFAVSRAQLKTEFFFLGGAIGGIGKLAASSFMCETVRVTSSTNSPRQLSRILGSARSARRSCSSRHGRACRA